MGLSVQVFADSSLESWIATERKVSLDKILKNISPPGTARGTVVASPSKDNPNYYFHWVRDSSLTMDQIVWLYDHAQGSDRSFYLGLIEDYVSLSVQEQSEPSQEGIGEPRYNGDGSVDTIPWSRPQFDGPALRALTLLHFLKSFGGAYPPAEEVIRKDLSFVLSHWRLPCFDLWEELRGLHFYTQSVQLAALEAGVRYFQTVGDNEFSLTLNQSAIDEAIELEKYWVQGSRYLGASRDLQLPDGSHYKASNLDTAVVLGHLHASRSMNEDHLIATTFAIERTFANFYSLNQALVMPAIGRFTDDVYYGGNPWFMTTAALAEVFYRLAYELKQGAALEVTSLNLEFLTLVSASPLKQGVVITSSDPLHAELVNALVERGDEELSVIKKFAGPQGELSEQFDRNSGVLLSAPDLTWSYASFLSATNYRALALSGSK